MNPYTILWSSVDITFLFASTFSLVEDYLRFQISKRHQAHFMLPNGTAKWQFGEDVWENLRRGLTLTCSEKILSSCWRLWALLNSIVCSGSFLQWLLQISYVPQCFKLAVCYERDSTIVHWNKLYFPQEFAFRCFSQHRQRSACRSNWSKTWPGFHSLHWVLYSAQFLLHLLGQNTFKNLNNKDHPCLGHSFEFSMQKPQNCNKTWEHHLGGNICRPPSCSPLL